MLYSYPPQSYVGKTVPKNKIYEQAHIASSLRRKIVDQIDRIVWEYKLSPETINLPATLYVPEIEVFAIYLKDDELSGEIVRRIDNVIPFPVIYEIVAHTRAKVMAAYKRPSEADSSKWVTETYFETDWFPNSHERISLFPSIDLGKLYEQMLAAMMPVNRRRDETFTATAARAGEIRRLEREADKLDSKLQKEKQFNRKVELNAALRELRRNIERLSQ